MMKVDSSFVSNAYKDISVTVSKKIDENKTIKGKDITNQYLIEYQKKMMSESKVEVTQQADTLTLADIGYNGKPIGELSQEEAKGLVAEDGFFGVSKTSERIANFVLSGAGDDVAMLKAGREGILKGFAEAEKMWGGKLPEISYTTIDKAVEMIDARLSELDAPIIDTNA